ncbi:histidine kinase [Streptomyces sp. NPDC049916]|uniref:sensor histidine kinase n=1 Tax=Streptomyces sp. NPDC049916 TaxID=3155156 RepID=UPI00342382FB
MKLDEALVDRIVRPLRNRLSGTSRWSPGRIVGESLLAVVIAGGQGLLDAVVGPGAGARTVLIALGLAVLSLSRRAFPATVLVLAAGAPVHLPIASLLLVCASWSAGGRVTRPGRLAAAFGAALALYIGPSTYEEFRADAELPLVTGAFSTVAFIVLAFVPGLTARYRAQRRSLLEALGRTNQQLVREQALVARQARLLERGRIAQDMHDSLGHQLVLISVHAGALQVDPDVTDRQREGLRVLRDASVAAMEELREAVGILREAGEARVLASVDDLVASSRAAGATVTLHRSGPVRPLAPAADHAAYRVAQEALTNAHKHAPGAPIGLTLQYESDTLIVEVRNGPPESGNPAASAAVSGGQGLTGMAERVRLVGGMLHSGPMADGGFRVAGMLPYGPAPGDAQPRPETQAPDAAPPRSPGPGLAEPTTAAAGTAAAMAGTGAVLDPGAPRGDFDALMSRRGKLTLGCAGTALVLGVGVIALGAWGMSALMDEVGQATIPPGVYEGVRPGDPEEDVQERLPDEDSFLTEDLRDAGPPRPEGATCRNFGSDDADDTSTVFRFCFRDGKLVEKLTFDGT